MISKERQQFQEMCIERENNECIIPWCTEAPDDVHHIVERELWSDGGYIPSNGASVCNHHHQYAEENHIPPQTFWMWAGVDNDNIVVPEQIETQDINKWGDVFDTPPWEDLRSQIKYQSTRHLLPLYWHDDTLAEERIEHDDTGLQSVEDFVGIPLVVTEKMDGGNMMIVSGTDTPVRARNGSRPKETMKLMYDDLYWRYEVNEKLPDRLQVFGEWLFAKHSIHYGCQCEDPCDDIGPALSDTVPYDDERAYFQIFGVYDTTLNLWLSWPEVEQVADHLGFPTTPVIYEETDSDVATFETTHEARQELIKYARSVIDNGGEGIVVRSKFPFHFGQFGRRVGKYVRENHVQTDEHWSHRETVTNNI